MNAGTNDEQIKRRMVDAHPDEKWLVRELYVHEVMPCMACAHGTAIAGYGDPDVLDDYRFGHEHYRRASGTSACEECGKEYLHHPHSGYRDCNGELWLSRLCDLSLVHL